jgi:hypothetical protein
MTGVWLFWGVLAGVIITLWIRIITRKAPPEIKRSLRIIGRSGVLRREKADLNRDESERWFV